MISIAGKEFRKLDDEFFVNGAKCVEAYVDGVKVYPDGIATIPVLFSTTPFMQMYRDPATESYNGYAAYEKDGWLWSARRRADAILIGASLVTLNDMRETHFWRNYSASNYPYGRAVHFDLSATFASDQSGNVASAWFEHNTNGGLSTSYSETYFEDGHWVNCWFSDWGPVRSFVCRESGSGGTNDAEVVLNPQRSYVFSVKTPVFSENLPGVVHHYERTEVARYTPGAGIENLEAIDNLGINLSARYVAIDTAYVLS